jgi:hypothetical protein
MKGEKKGSKKAAALEAAMDAYLDLLDKIAAVNAATEEAFTYGPDVRVLDPAAGKGAKAAQQEATEAAQVSVQIRPRCVYVFFPSLSFKMSFSQPMCRLGLQKFYAQSSLQAGGYRVQGMVVEGPTKYCSEASLRKEAGHDAI